MTSSLLHTTRGLLPLMITAAVGLCTSLSGCESRPAPTSPPAQPSTASEPAPSPPSHHASTQPGAGETHASSCAAYSELDALDPRQPVPLQPMMAWHQKQNMQDHLVVIQQIQDALARDDWEKVVEVSERIGSSPQMARMCQHMGAGAPGFTELALEFHRRADGITAAATARDLKATLSATASTLETCTSCHAAYRQEVVDAATWRERTGSTHQPGMDQHGHP